MKYQELINNLENTDQVNENDSITWSRLKKLLQTNNQTAIDTDTLNSASERRYQKMFTNPQQSNLDSDSNSDDQTQNMTFNNTEPDDENEENEDEIDPKTGLKKKNNPIVDPNNPNNVTTESIDMNVYLKYLEKYPFTRSNPFNVSDK